MTNIICPDDPRLQNLLDGNLSNEQQAELNSHLESCRACQQRLDALAAGKETWTEMARNLNAAGGAPEAGLQRVMTESKKEGEPESPPAEVPLDFLSPPDDPAHLGRLGNYQVLEVISRGGMSVVLKAFDPSLHRMVAIKVLAPQLATTAAARTRFRREGSAVAAISHEHVVAVYAVDEINGLPYLVMEYISGQSLQERLDRDGPLELKEVLRIGMQIAQGLAAAHAQGLVHRDIKPANILLHNGVARVKITDFGLARAVDDATLTQSGFVAGTPQYMSPEQARGDAIDARTDLFSLGSVLYAMCAGRPPFRASTTMGVLKRVSDENPRPVREVNPEVPPWLHEIIGKLHAKNPADRYQSAAEVAEVLGRNLAQLQQGMPIAAPEMPASKPPAPQKPKSFRKRPWAIAAALLPILAGAFVASEATGVTNVTEFVATVLRINTRDGILVIETDDPGIEVLVEGEDIKIRGAGPKEIHLRPGQHRLRATKDGKVIPLAQDLVTVTRGGRQIVKIRLEGPKEQGKATKAGPDEEMNPRARAAIENQLASVGTHDGVVWSLVFAPDGKTLVSSGDGPGNPTKEPVSGELKLWDITRLLDAERPPGEKAREIWSATAPSSILAVAISPGGTTLATAEADGTVRLREADTGRVLKILRGHKGPVYTLAFAPDGQTLASAGLDRTVKIWRVGTRELLESFDSGNTKLAKCLAFSKDGKTLAVGGEDHHPLGGRILADAEDNIPDKKRSSHTVRLFNVGSWKVRAVLTGHSGPVVHLAFSPDGKLLATASEDKSIKLWKAADGKELATLRDPRTGKIRCVAFSPDSSVLAGGSDNRLTLWDVEQRKILGTPELTLGGQGKIHSLAYSPDGRTLAFAGAKHLVKVWIAGLVGGQAKVPNIGRDHLATLREIQERTEMMYKNGFVSAEMVAKAQVAVLEAELKLCNSPRERLPLLAKIVTHWQEAEKRLEKSYKAGVVTEQAVLRARLKRQEAEIELRREKDKVAK